MPEFPEKPTLKYEADGTPHLSNMNIGSDILEYQLAYQQALGNAVKFRDSHAVKNTMFFSGQFNGMRHKERENKIYDCPEYYEIVIENGYATLKPIK